jgi:uncharacterized protein (TIGR03790 family)
MAERKSACRKAMAAIDAMARLMAYAAALAGAGTLAAQTPAGALAAPVPATSAAAAIASPPRALLVPAWMAVPHLSGRLHAADLGLIINTADPYSVRVGEHYIAARRLAPRQVLRLALPRKPVITAEEFEPLRAAIAARFGPSTQALALAWTAPYAVACNSITGALGLGYDGDLCKHSCAASRPSNYFNSPSARPLADHGWRPSMLLAAASVEQALALIDRGVAADGQLALRGRPPVSALLLTTTDVARSVRRVLYPPPGLLRGWGVDVRVEPAGELARARRVLLAITGSVRVALDPAPDWVAGGLGDHLTSVGGNLEGELGQSTALEWITSGATASHGTVSEPCNHLQKFPHPQVLLLQYLQGGTAIEAYWKSVAWPQQSLFIGEPLAAPFARR